LAENLKDIRMKKKNWPTSYIYQNMKIKVTVNLFCWQQEQTKVKIFWTDIIIIFLIN